MARRQRPMTKAYATAMSTKVSTSARPDHLDQHTFELYRISD